MRVLNIDIETLDPAEPIIPQLFQAVEDDLKVHTKYAAENHFVLGYLSMLMEKNEQAHQHFAKIESENALFGTMHFYDGIALRKMGESNHSKKNQAKICKTSIDRLDKVNELTPGYFSSQQPKELTLSTFCYFNALVETKKLNLQESQWFQNTLRDSSEWIETSKREELFFNYFDRMKNKLKKDEMVAYLEFGLTLFPTNLRLISEAQKAQIELPPTAITATASIEETEQQAQAIFNQARSLQSRNERIPALRRWLDIITQFPGSYTAEKAKQEIMSLVRDDVQSNRPTTQYQDDLKKLPPDMIFDLAKYLWNRDYNMSAYALYTHLVEHYPYYEKTSEAEYSIARMHEDWSEWPKAIKYYSDLVKKYSRSKFFDRSHFKIGFLYYMNGEYQKAVVALAKEKDLVTDPHQKAQACYWLGRTYEKMHKKADAAAQFQEIQKKYPLTYYSFILGIDPQVIKQNQTNIQPLEIDTNHPLFLPLTYLGVGLHKPARQMIQQYGNQNDEHMYQIVQLFHDTGFHIFSMPNALALTEKNMEKSGIANDLLQMIFPVKYLELVQKESSGQIDPLVVLSLIKQESGYFERAVSNARAVGLMQLLVPTAQTIAKKFNDPLPDKDDLYEPDKNIRIGVEYLTGLNQQFNNDITLVLSAYNAGPERAIKWKNRWPTVRKDEFVELIPFPETRVYVKLILRNYSYYKYLVQNQNPNIRDFGF